MSSITAQVVASNPWSAAGEILERQRSLGPITRVARDAPLLPSFAQERVWQMSLASRSNPYFNVCLVWDVAGPLNVRALEEALKELVRRHEALCSCFKEVNGEPHVIIHNGECRFETRSADAADPAAQRTAALESAGFELQQPVNLETGPVFRAILFRCTDAKALLFLGIHQIAFDGASMPLVARELKQHYEAQLRGTNAPCPQLPIQYYDFACWQRQLLADGRLAKEEAFWDTQFAKPYLPLRLGNALVDHRGLPTPTKRVGFRISQPVCSQLARLAGEAGATPFSFLLAAFHSYLHIHTDCDDSIIFATVAGRSQPELRNLVGLVANVLPFRINFAPDDAFSDVVERVAKATSLALANQALPLDQILRRIEIEGRPQAGGLFQAMLIYENLGSCDFSVGATKFVRLHELDSGFGRFGIQVEIQRTVNGMEGWVKYRTEMFPGDFGDQFADEFPGLLEGWANQPRERLGPKSRPGFGLAGDRVQSPADPARPADPPLATPLLPRDALEESLVRIWERVLGVSPVRVQDDFFSLGGDSLLAVRIMVEIDRLTGRQVPISRLLQAPTVEKLARLLREEMPQTAGKSLVTFRVGGSRQAVYFVHSLGGKVLGLHALVERLAKDQTAYGLESVGLDGVTKPLDRVEDMAAHYLKEIQRVQPRGPYALVGASFGGMVAYEMAQQLTAQGQGVSFLGLFDTTAPECRLAFTFRERLSREVFLYGRRLYRRVVHHSNQLFRLDWPGRLGYVRAGLETLWRRRKSVLSENAYYRRSRKTESLVPAFVRVNDTNRAARDAYRYCPYPGKVTLFRAEESGAHGRRDPESAWREYARGGLEVHRVPGNHQTMLDEPNVAVLAQKLQSCLDRLPEASRSLNTSENQ